MRCTAAVEAEQALTAAAWPLLAVRSVQLPCHAFRPAKLTPAWQLRYPASCQALTISAPDIPSIRRALCTSLTFGNEGPKRLLLQVLLQQGQSRPPMGSQSMMSRHGACLTCPSWGCATAVSFQH